jgi:hypothetical protein
MRASEWQFLCAVHESPKSCCAIDYCCHTLDWATNIVTSQKIFPSRLSLGAGDATDDRGAGVKHLTNIFRRLHRIFAHAWFQHRGVFWQVEGQTGLYVLFKTVCDTYELLPAENYKLPPEAEGLEPVEELKAPAPTILKAEGNHKPGSSIEDDFMNVSRSGTSTRRHIRQSPSVGSAVPTVLESDEEDPDVTAKFKDLEVTEEEEEDAGNTTEVPVIVESYEVDEHHDGSPPKAESPVLEHTEPESEAPEDPSTSLTPDSSEDEPEEEEKEEPKEADDDDAAESMSPILPVAEITITAPSPVETEAKSVEGELKKEEPNVEKKVEKAETQEKAEKPEEEEKNPSP